MSPYALSNISTPNLTPISSQIYTPTIMSSSSSPMMLNTPISTISSISSISSLPYCVRQNMEPIEPVEPFEMNNNSNNPYTLFRSYTMDKLYSESFEERLRVSATQDEFINFLKQKENH